LLVRQPFRVEMVTCCHPGILPFGYQLAANGRTLQFGTMSSTRLRSFESFVRKDCAAGHSK